MLELRSPLVASAVTAAVGLSLTVAAPAIAADKASSATAKAAVKAKAAKKKTTKKKAAAPKTVTACVNKKSGATKVLLGSKAKRKCAKGWTKMTWNVAGTAGKNGAAGAAGTTGAAGAKGADGAALLVRDQAGNRMGFFAGASAFPVPFPIVQVLAADGGIYTYLESGQLLPSGTFGASPSPLFTDPGCAGPAFMTTPPSGAIMMSVFAGGPTRIVFRSMAGPSFESMSAARAWKFTTSISTLAVVPTAYQPDVAGSCLPVSPVELPAVGDVKIDLQEIPAPPDGVGRLVIG